MRTGHQWYMDQDIIMHKKSYEISFIHWGSKGSSVSRETWQDSILFLAPSSETAKLKNGSDV